MKKPTELEMSILKLALSIAERLDGEDGLIDSLNEVIEDPNYAAEVDARRVVGDVCVSRLTNDKWLRNKLSCYAPSSRDEKSMLNPDVHHPGSCGAHPSIVIGTRPYCRQHAAQIVLYLVLKQGCVRLIADDITEHPAYAAEVDAL